MIEAELLAAIIWLGGLGITFITPLQVNAEEVMGLLCVAIN